MQKCNFAVFNPNGCNSTGDAKSQDAAGNIIRPDSKRKEVTALVGKFAAFRTSMSKLSPDYQPVFSAGC